MEFDGSTSPRAVLDAPAPPAPPTTWQPPAGALPPGTPGTVNWPTCARLHATPATILDVVPPPGAEYARPGEFVYRADVPAAGSGFLILWPSEFRPTPPEKPKTPGAAITTRAQSKAAGYEGDPCGTCGALMLARNGACLKCDNCGATTGCS